MSFRVAHNGFALRAFVLCAAALAAVTFPLLSLAALNAVSYESIYRTRDNKRTILLPANWIVHEWPVYTTLNGAEVELISMWDQADWGSRLTRSGYIMRSTPAGVFRLQPSIIARLTPQESVNHKVYDMVRHSVGGRVISAKVSERNGEKVYTVEWTYTATELSDKLQFVAFEEFIFRGDSVFWIHGEYATIRTNARESIMRMVQSFTAEK